MVNIKSAEYNLATNTNLGLLSKLYSDDSLISPNAIENK
jgi:hypothetical protein